MRRIENAKEALAHEEQKYQSTIKAYKQIFYSDPMELAKALLVEKQHAAMVIQVTN